MWASRGWARTQTRVIKCGRATLYDNSHCWRCPISCSSYLSILDSLFLISIDVGADFPCHWFFSCLIRWKSGHRIPVNSTKLKESQRSLLVLFRMIIQDSFCPQLNCLNKSLISVAQFLLFMPFPLFPLMSQSTECVPAHFAPCISCISSFRVKFSSAAELTARLVLFPTSRSAYINDTVAAHQSCALQL